MKLFSKAFGSDDPALEIKKSDDPLEKQAKLDERKKHALSMVAIIAGGIAILIVSIIMASQ